MNDIETHSSERNPDLELIVESLQRQVFLLLLALIIISATVVFYLSYQARIYGNELHASQPQAKQLMDNYRRELPVINSFDQQIGSYALTHPDFQRVLAKYGWSAAAAKQQKH